MRHSHQTSAIEHIIGYDPFVTTDQMLAEGSLRGLVVEAANVDEAIDKINQSLDQAKEVVESIKKSWRESINASGLAVGNEFQAWLDAFENKIEDSRQLILDLEAEPPAGDWKEKTWDKVLSFFGKDKKSAGIKEKIEKAAEHVLLAESLRKSLVKVNGLLIRVTPGAAKVSEAKIKELVQRQFKAMETELKGSGVELGDHMPNAAAIIDDIPAVLAKLGNEALKKAQQELEAHQVSPNPVLAPTATPPAAPAAPTTPAATAGRGAPAVPATPAATPATPAASDAPVAATEPTKIKRSNLKKIIKTFVDKNGPIPTTTDPEYQAKVDALLDRVRDSLGSKGIQLESLKNSSLEDKLIIERINRMAGLPYTEE